MILVTGCSWTDLYPQFIERAITHRPLGGRGLPQIRDSLKEDPEDYERVILQLPTPVRSFPGEIKDRRILTRDLHQQFLRSGWPKNRLLSLYLDQMEEISKIYPTTFFLFNTGGYPLRSPLDFGELAERAFLRRAKEMGLEVISLSFQGHQGYCRIEKSLTQKAKELAIEKMAKKFGYEEFAFQHPPGVLILDAHPNPRAAKIAARFIEDYLGGRK